ncbi:hypothetical protein QQS45_08330 [Alteriqipengyuania flavescens]|uniref:hypothetical protein n=1 Tax=Alteriqipengyuania flavescens TaxID=3053610 RepID=UPI0025B5320A|nr:hypothetical protein [Alteriqipengyuania flavescens]WJY17653.1 hypothetical protein QQW98_08325 [Alteriqipengyuania flavescens]WJY23596.1 hypothetical protein QQS45_08330 [Alteriqipengyuania flavescens]
MTEATNAPKPAPKPLIRRTTAMADAMLSACQKAGIDTSNATVKAKTEPAWTVTRRDKRDRRPRRRR